MALFHLPGLSPVDFYWQSRVVVFGFVGARPSKNRRVEGVEGKSLLPSDVDMIAHLVVFVNTFFHLFCS